MSAAVAASGAPIAAAAIGAESTARRLIGWTSAAEATDKSWNINMTYDPDGKRDRSSHLERGVKLK